MFCMVKFQGRTPEQRDEDKDILKIADLKAKIAKLEGKEGKRSNKLDRLKADLAKLEEQETPKQPSSKPTPGPASKPKGTPPAAPETIEEVSDLSQENRDKLRNEVDVYLQKEVDLIFISQQLLEAGLTPVDLLRGTNRADAIDVVMLGHPAEARMLKAMLEEPDLQVEVDAILTDSMTVELHWTELQAKITP